ncbi:MAG: hypothetical protein RMJ52_05360, partial [Gemmataceae bacterium]|nr:hypothetical protein [Gemmataceae bacterium]
KLHFAGEAAPADLESYGEVVERAGPVAELRIARAGVAPTLAAILDRHTIVDVSVQDPPLDEVIARVFEQGKAAAGVG